MWGPVRVPASPTGADRCQAVLVADSLNLSVLENWQPEQLQLQFSLQCSG